MPIRPAPNGVRIALHVQPRAARTEMAGLHGEAIKLRIASPPVDGAANEAVIAFLADRLDVPRRAVTLAAGMAGRRKVVQVVGISVEQARRALALPG